MGDHIGTGLENKDLSLARLGEHVIAWPKHQRIVLGHDDQDRVIRDAQKDWRRIDR